MTISFHICMALLVVLGQYAISYEKIMYGYCKDKPLESVQLSPKLINSSSTIFLMREDSSKTLKKISIPFNKNDFIHFQSLIHDNKYIENLPNAVIERLHAISIYFETHEISTTIASLLWDEYNNGYNISSETLRAMKRELRIASTDNKCFKKQFAKYYEGLVTPLREFEAIDFTRFFIGRRFIGFVEERPKSFSSLFSSKYVACFMALKKVFKDNSPSLQDCIRNNALVTIDIGITNLDSRSFVFRDDNKGFTLIECKKNGALHRWADKKLISYRCNFRDVSDVIVIPHAGFWLMYQKPHHLLLYLFKFGNDEYRSNNKEFYPYQPWFIEFVDKFKEYSYVFLNFQSTNEYAIAAIHNNSQILHHYSLQEWNHHPKSNGRTAAFNCIPYDAVNQRNFKHFCSELLTPMNSSIISISPDKKLVVIKKDNELFAEDTNGIFSKKLLTYEGHDVYFLSNTVLLIENIAKNQMVFFDMSHWNLSETRFLLSLAQ